MVREKRDANFVKFRRAHPQKCLSGSISALYDDESLRYCLVDKPIIDGSYILVVITINAPYFKIPIY